MSNRPLLLGAIAIAIAFPVIAIASPVAIPHAFEDDAIISAAEFNENFDAIATAVNDNDARIAALEAGGSGIPTGTIAFFAADDCPPEWDDFDALRGRVPLGLPDDGTVSMTMGDAIEGLGTRTIDEVVSHTHGLGTLGVTDNGGTHGHVTNTDGAHRHVLTTASQGPFYATSAVSGTSGSDDTAADAIGTGQSTHSHTIPTSGGHDHTLNGTLASTGEGTVDVTMPYIQLLPCVKL